MAEAAHAASRDRFFWLLWSFDALTAAVLVFFFLWGLADGSVSSFNIVLWLGILATAAAVVVGSLALRNAGQNALAVIMVAVFAFPGLMFALFMLAVLILQPRWN
jgi:hypothetical protein